MEISLKRNLLWHGAVLLLLGLLSGACIPLVTNARMGLSAHLAGVQNGMLLMIVGLAWSSVALSARLAAATFWLLLYSMYAIWASTLLGAFLGTSRLTPLAGEGHAGTPWEELLVSSGLATGSAAVLVGMALFIYGLGAGAQERRSQ
ncbi:MAG: hydrogenase [Deltaproteobacteria bacterium]|nr:MAG: hydrogenase [Deltaproteobacteria bacterium]